jgi:hypothetical protein
MRHGRILDRGEVRVTPVVGGKLARLIEEQKRINELGGIEGGLLSNKRNALHPDKWPSVGIQPPTRWGGGSMRQ